MPDDIVPVESYARVGMAKIGKSLAAKLLLAFGGYMQNATNFIRNDYEPEVHEWTASLRPDQLVELGNLLKEHSDGN